MAPQSWQDKIPTLWHVSQDFSMTSFLLASSNTEYLFQVWSLNLQADWSPCIALTNWWLLLVPCYTVCTLSYTPGHQASHLLSFCVMTLQILLWFLFFAPLLEPEFTILPCFVPSLAYFNLWNIVLQEGVCISVSLTVSSFNVDIRS